MIRKASSGSTKFIKQETLHLYARSLKEPVPLIEPRINVQFDISREPIELDNVDYETVRARIASGNLIFIARYRSRVVGYLFISTTNCEVGEIEDMLTIHKGEVYFYDAFTCEGFRGNRIYPALLSTASAYFKECAFANALIFTRESNVNSVRGIERAGFSRYQVIRFTNRFGEKSWDYSLRSGDVRSQFSNENG